MGILALWPSMLLRWSPHSTRQISQHQICASDAVLRFVVRSVGDVNAWQSSAAPLCDLRQIQAGPRPMVFEYYRHGILSLYAALDTRSGEILGKTA
jgi:hypothetical protein